MKVDMSSLVLAALKHEFNCNDNTVSLRKFGLNLCACRSIDGVWSICETDNCFIKKTLIANISTEHKCAEKLRDIVVERLEK